MLVRLANREYHDHNASSEAVWSEFALLLKVHFDWQVVFEILEHLP